MPMVDGLSERFQENVECSTHVDIAVAWATKTAALEQLEKAVKKKKNSVSLRIIVGTHGNATDPDALDRLNGIGELRLFPHRGRLFHSKIYIFHRKKDSIAWIGSANFTNGGFGKNVEAVFETKQLKSVLSWFEVQWGECGELTANAIEEYRTRRRLKPPSRVLRDMIGAPMRDPEGCLKYLDGVQNWSGYVEALKLCQKWWESRPGRWTVYGGNSSWIHTIEHVGPVATMDDWNGLDSDQIKQLVGRYRDDELDSGLLGNMFPAAVRGFVQNFREDQNLRSRLKEAVNLVVNAHSNDFPNVAVKAARELVQEQNKNIGVGVATRILALARPDRVVSLNGASWEGLAQIFPGIDRLNPKDYYPNVPEDYGRFLGQLYEEPWFDSPEPNDECEKRLWSMRAALLDCFVYSE